MSNYGTLLRVVYTEGTCMTSKSLTVIPIPAPVEEDVFDLLPTLHNALETQREQLQSGDILAISSKYVAIAEGRVVELADVKITAKAHSLAKQYNMNPAIAQLVLDEAEHIFGGIQLGFLLTWRSGVIAPNAGLDRSNIPRGKAVLLPQYPYRSAEIIRQSIQEQLGIEIGIILTDSWLVPGRWGTTGVALSSAGFAPVQDERGKPDLFGNPMMVTQVGIADSLAVCAQMVMGERDQATPFAIIRDSQVSLTNDPISQDDLSIPWEQCIYVESLTWGLLENGAPREAFSASLANSVAGS